MDMQGALRARLIADTAVAALVAARVYWVTRPQASALPAIVMQTISDPRPQHLNGFQELRETRVQVDVFALSYSEIRALTEAVIAALAPQHTGNGIIFNRAMVDSVRDLGEQTATQFIHRNSIDFILWWQSED